jgi:cyclopropane fatty-acyl-phospholipid synthase-like methyltransferase
LRIGWSEIYANTDILSPIDRETWQVIGQTCKLTPVSRVIELASGKGAFALDVAEKFGCRVDCYDRDSEFVKFSLKRAHDLSLASRVKFTISRVEEIEVETNTYDVGVCLGALYIFRDAGWRVLWNGVKDGGYLVISDLFCKKASPPKGLMEIFFEDEGGALTLDEARTRYIDRGSKILREEECSRAAWLNYYDLTKKTFQALSEKNLDDKEKQQEISEAMREDELVRECGEEYLGYMTFIMQKP